MRVFIKLILLIAFLIIYIINSDFINFIYNIIFCFDSILINKKVIFKVLILESVDLLWIYNLKLINFWSRIQKITSSNFKTSIAWVLTEICVQWENSAAWLLMYILLLYIILQTLLAVAITPLEKRKMKFSKSGGRLTMLLGSAFWSSAGEYFGKLLINF